jgi:hypothetical protein
MQRWKMGRELEQVPPSERVQMQSPELPAVARLRQVLAAHEPARLQWQLQRRSLDWD